MDKDAFAHQDRTRTCYTGKAILLIIYFGWQQPHVTSNEEVAGWQLGDLRLIVWELTPGLYLVTGMLQSFCDEVVASLGYFRVVDIAFDMSKLQSVGYQANPVYDDTGGLAQN